MGLSTEYDLKDSTGKVVGSVIPLNNNTNRLFGLYKRYGLDEFIVTDNRLEKIKEHFNLTRVDQTSIFDFIQE